jgi:hypothetical protein
MDLDLKWFLMLCAIFLSIMLTNGALWGVSELYNWGWIWKTLFRITYFSSMGVLVIILFLFQIYVLFRAHKKR